MKTQSLSELPVDREAEVVRIEGGTILNERLTALGIGRGQKVRKISNVGLGGPLIIEVNRAQVAIGRGMAMKIVVRDLDNE